MTRIAKWVGPGVAAIALFALASGAHAQTFDHESYLSKLYDDAKAKGESEVTMYSNNSQNFKEIFAAFEKKYNIHVRVTDIFGPPAVARLDADYATNNIQADILMSGVSDLIVFHDRGWLEKWIPDSAKLEDPKLIGPDDTWFSFAVLPLGTVVNTTLVKKADYPLTNADHVADRWKDQITMNNPSASSGLSQGVGVLIENKVVGYDWLEKLAALNPLIGASSMAALQLAVTGQRAISPFVSLNTFLDVRSKGAPVDYVIPSDGYAAIAAPNGLAVKAPHPEAAKLLLAWFLSPEAQALFTKSGQPGAMPGAPNPDGFPELAKYKRYTMSTDWLRNEYGKMLARNKEIFKN